MIDKAIRLADQSRKSVHLTDKALMLLELNREKEALACLRLLDEQAKDYSRYSYSLNDYS